MVKPSYTWSKVASFCDFHLASYDLWGCSGRELKGVCTYCLLTWSYGVIGADSHTCFFGIDLRKRFSLESTFDGIFCSPIGDVLGRRCLHAILIINNSS